MPVCSGRASVHTVQAGLSGFRADGSGYAEGKRSNPAADEKRTSDACRGSGDSESRQYAGTKPELLAGLPGKIRSRGYGKAYLSPGKRL